MAKMKMPVWRVHIQRRVWKKVKDVPRQDPSKNIALSSHLCSLDIKPMMHTPIIPWINACIPSRLVPSIHIELGENQRTLIAGGEL